MAGRKITEDAAELFEPKDSRRNFLRRLALAALMVTGKGKVSAASQESQAQAGDRDCVLLRAVNGSPEMNMGKLLEMLGGVEAIVGQDDLVIVKPNVQWWNQGAPNLAALCALVDRIMSRPGGFRGEVVVAENCHRGANPAESSGAGWTRDFLLNSDIPGVRNMNDLARLLKGRYGDKFTACHWINVGSGGRRVSGPGEGPGYVFCDGTGGTPLMKCDNGRGGDDARTSIMTYPIFITDRGTVVDFKNGVWESGGYTDRPVRFINFAALNHHSTYCGATSAVKNHMGITDLSGGEDPREGGLQTKDYYNIHSFALDKWAPGPAAGALGKAIGTFIHLVRKADLNITTAEWVGLSSRVFPPVSHTRAILACTDPVALDYHATKYVLFANSGISVHNPDAVRSPMRHDLMSCAEQYGGIFDENRVKVRSYDLGARRYQTSGEMRINGDIEWGKDIKPLLRYGYLRLFS